MEQITSQFSQEMLILIIGALAAFSFVLSIFAYTRTKSSNKLSVELPQTNAQGIAGMHSDIDLLMTKQKQFEATLAQYGTRHMTTVVHRFNPFKDNGVGGNQSFSIAHIDQNGDGFIITHLFSRELSRVQAKEINKWQSESELLPEEQESLESIKQK